MQEKVRRTRLAKAAAKAGLDGVLVTHLADLRYLTGFTGSNGALAMAGGRAALFTDGRYTEQAREQAAGLRVVIERAQVQVRAAEWLAKCGVRRCGFEAAHTTVAELEGWRTGLKASAGKGAKSGGAGLGAVEVRAFFQPMGGLVARQREVKDAGEIERMRRAAALGCALFGHVLEHMAPGVPEAEVAAQLEFAARMAGAEAMSFETIVTGGKRSALPHGRASGAKLPKRGFCTLDFGVLLDGYCSDMTRTVHLGKASGREREVYGAVLAAQLAGLAAVRAGVTGEAVDGAARSVLARTRLDGAPAGRATLDRWFTHSTGHGVGLEIHEGPRLAAKQTQVLEAGMVVTIEPGVYLPGEFGVRIEDMVVVTEGGCDVLSAASPKELLELG